MCKLLVGVSKERNNKNFIDSIVTQFDGMRTQKDGIGAFVLTHDNKFHIFRSFTDYDSVFENVESLLPNARLVSVHTRISTGGKLGLENVHFFDYENVILAHNGIIDGYSKIKPYTRGHWNNVTRKWDDDEDEKPMVILNAKADRTAEEQALFDESVMCEGCASSKAGTCKKHIKKAQELVRKQKEAAANNQAELLWTREDEPGDTAADDCPTFPDNPCDSLEFLRDLEKPISEEGINALVEEKKMNGMMVIFDKSTSKAFIVVKKACHVISDKKTFSVMYSFDPETKFTEPKWKYMFGVPFKDRTVTYKLPYQSKALSYGTWQIKY